MISSKATFSKLLTRLAVTSVASASLALTVGCFKPQAREPGQAFMTEDEKREESSASFLVDEVKGRSETAEDFEGFSIPKARLYNFSVCVKDRRTQDAIKGHSFEISGGREPEVLKSDVSGCVQWSEKIEFNFLGDESYLPIRRVIKAQGMHVGSRALRVAINPWNLSGRSQDVVDLSKGKVPDGTIVDEKDVEERLEGLSAAGRSASRQLWLKSSDLVSNPGDGAQGRIERAFTLIVEPALLHSDLQKQPVVHSLKEARLRLSLVLIEVKTVGGLTSQEVVWRTSAPQPVAKDGDRFKLQVRVPFGQGETYSRYFVALRAEPFGAPKGIESFEGLFAMGSFEQIMGGTEKLPFVLKQSNVDGSFEFDAFLKSIEKTGASGALVNMTPSLKGSVSQGIVPAAADLFYTKTIGGLGSSGQLTQGPAGTTEATKDASSQLKVFNIGIMKIQKSGIEDESATTRIVHFSPVACIKDNSNGGKSAAGVEFMIQKSNGSIEKATALRTTGSEGCFTWTDRITHKFYQKERYYFVPVVIRHEKTGFEERRTLAVNPWGEGNIGGDLQDNPKIYEEINQRAATSSRLLSTSFRFETVDYRAYEIDEFLALKQIKRIQLTLPFTVDRSNSINDGRSSFPRGIRDGVYLLKAALHAVVLDPSGKPLHIVSPMIGGASLVCAKEGKIWDIAEFAIQDTHLMKTRSSVIYEVKPVDVEKLPAEIREEKDLCRSLHKISAPGEALVDQDSGLVTPTFIAPMWIKDDQGGATVFPSDWLASKLDQKSGASTKLDARDFESLRPLAGITVDQILEKADRLKEAYRKRNRSLMSMLDFARYGNLEFVTLENEDVVLSREPKLSENNVSLSVKGGARQLVELLNLDLGKYSRHAKMRSSVFAHKSPISKESLGAFIAGRREMDIPMAGRMCLLLMRQLPKRLVPEGLQLIEPGALGGIIGKLVTLESPEQELSEACIRQLDSTAEIKPFIVERKLRVFEREASKPHDFKGGHDLAISVGNEVSFGRSRSVSVSQGAEFRPLKLAEGLANLGGNARVFNAASGLGIGVGVGIGMSQGSSVGEGSAIKAGRTLAMESIEMVLRLKRYETCVVVRPNPSYWELRTSGAKMLNPKLTDEQKLAVLSRGLLLCFGSETKEPLTVRERYYSLTEQWFDGATVDPGDTRNHPWMINLRGVRDYTNLLALMGGKMRNELEITEKFDFGEMTVSRLQQAYRGFMPTLPGIYTWDPHISPAGGQAALAH